jgi:hypothetical protein
MQTNDQGPPSTAQEKPSEAAGGSVRETEYVAWLRYIARMVDMIKQSLMNNLWDNNPVEISRWEDDGGVAIDG